MRNIFHNCCPRFFHRNQDYESIELGSGRRRYNIKTEKANDEKTPFVTAEPSLPIPSTTPRKPQPKKTETPKTNLQVKTKRPTEEPSPSPKTPDSPSSKTRTLIELMKNYQTELTQPTSPNQMPRNLNPPTTPNNNDAPYCSNSEWNPMGTLNNPVKLPATFMNQ